MKRSFIIAFTTASLLVVYTPPAKAQFWKKLFKKEQPKHKAGPKKNINKPAAPVVTIKKREIDYPATIRKPRYRIDVLIPLYLNDLVKDGKPTFKGRLPEKAIQGMGFYEGVKIATDTLNKLSYQVDIYIHDITDPAKTPEKLATGKTFDSSDLIIGAVSAQHIPLIADAAKKYHINFISVSSPSDGGIQNNAFFTLLQPSLQTHCEWIVNQVKNKSHKNQPVLFYRTGIAVDESSYKYITSNAKKEYFQKLSCNTLPTRQQLSGLFDSTKTNVVVAGIVDPNYAEKILQHLHQLYPGYRFEVYGMPSWKTMATLKKPEAYPNIAVYITAPFYYDISTPMWQSLANNYKTISGSNKPDEAVYLGYETLYWYVTLLNKYGTIFNHKMSESKGTPFTRFDIKPQWTKNDDLLYNENTHIYLYRYQSSSFSVVQ